MSMQFFAFYHLSDMEDGRPWPAKGYVDFQPGILLSFESEVEREEWLAAKMEGKRRVEKLDPTEPPPRGWDWDDALRVEIPESGRWLFHGRDGSVHIRVLEHIDITRIRRVHVPRYRTYNGYEVGTDAQGNFWYRLFKTGKVARVPKQHGQWRIEFDVEQAVTGCQILHDLVCLQKMPSTCEEKLSPDGLVVERLVNRLLKEGGEA